MRRITQRTQFRNDLKLQKRRGKNVEELIAAVELLAENGVLPKEYQAHKLSGEWKGLWECHIEPDWLLIYDITSQKCYSFEPEHIPICSIRAPCHDRGWVSSRFAQGRGTAQPD
jgi:mRNA interferase YafQ